MSATIWSTAYRLINTCSEYKVDDRISGNTLKRLIREVAQITVHGDTVNHTVAKVH